MRNKKDLNCYQEIRNRKKQEKFLFYLLEIIAAAVLLFAVYIYLGN